MSKVFDLTPETDGPRRSRRWPGSFDEGSSAGSGNAGVGAANLFVSGFHTAPPQEGGDGVTMVGLSKT